MNRLRIVSLALTVVCVVALASLPTAKARRRAEGYAPGEIIVKLRGPGVDAPGDVSSPATEDRLLSVALGLSRERGAAGDPQPLIGAPANGRMARIVARRGLDRVFLLKFAPDSDIESIITDLMASGGVEYAEPNLLIQAADVLPNDPDFSLQWALRNLGTGVQGFPSTFRADIRAPAAWDYTTGSSDVIVAVTDTGIDITHPDLAENIYVNPNEIPDNGIDDDHNGYVDDVNGVNIPRKNGDVSDVTGHGTEMAGIIAARLNNEVGVGGVSQSTLLPVCFFKRGDSPLEYDATAFDAAAALLYSIGAGAQIINASWSAKLTPGTVPAGSAQALQDAVAATNDAGVLLVGVAGNEGFNLDFSRIYPASYLLPNQIVVAASDFNDEIWHEPFFPGVLKSGFGPNSVHLAAPGVSVFTTRAHGDCIDCSTSPDPGEWYTKDPRVDGTSAAAAYVSGVAALVKSIYPDDNFILLKRRLLESVDVVEKFRPYLITGGRLNAAKALAVQIESSTPVITKVKVKKQGRKVIIYGTAIQKNAVLFIGRVGYPISPKVDDYSVIKVNPPGGLFPVGSSVDITLLNPDGGMSPAFTITR
jgi:subtilisin family serine protease